MIRFTRTLDTSTPLSVGYSVTGPAVAGEDYQQLSGVAVIPAGQSYVDVPVRAIDDDLLLESDEDVIVTVSPAGIYAVGGSSATVVVRDDDATA